MVQPNAESNRGAIEHGVQSQSDQMRSLVTIQPDVESDRGLAGRKVQLQVWSDAESPIVIRPEAKSSPIGVDF